MAVAYAHRGWAAAPLARAAAPEIPSDEVFGRIANGDQLAMRTLFRRHRLAIYRWLVRMAGDAGVAENLLSDVFLDVWRNAASFKGCPVSTWLLAIARHKALSARGSRPHAERNDEIASTVADEPSNDPELALQKKGRAEALRHALARLSPEHGEVVDLVYYHSKSVKEVAEIVGIDEATVKTRMFYARRQLAGLAALSIYACALKSL